jgi:hypothetical protein
MLLPRSVVAFVAETETETVLLAPLVCASLDFSCATSEFLAISKLEEHWDFHNQNGRRVS